MKRSGMRLLFCTAAMAGILLTGCQNDQKETAEQEVYSDQIASEEEKTAWIDVVEDDMVPIMGTSVKDGVYEAAVDSSSSMFKIYSCELQVSDDTMTAVMKFEGDSYTKVFLGTSEEAVRASEDAFIFAEELENGFYTFTIPVEALDKGIDCAAFSRRKEKWYDRTIVFRADSLPLEAFDEDMIPTVSSLGLEDGTYMAEVTLGGGSGRASIESPTLLRVEDGNAYAVITWGSANYDYMKVDGQKYQQINTEGNSVFEIPVQAFDWKIGVLADTIAMSVPHEIDYTLYFDSSTLTKAE